MCKKNCNAALEIKTDVSSFDNVAICVYLHV